MALLHGPLLTDGQPGGVPCTLEGNMPESTTPAQPHIPLWRKVWLRIHEPRAVAVVHFFTYTGLFLGGITGLIDPPSSLAGQAGEVTMWLVATMLTVGGALGAVSVLPGWWWLERYGTMLVITGITSYGGLVAVLQFTQPGNRLFQLSIITALLGHIIIRMIRIWERPFDPARRRG